MPLIYPNKVENTLNPESLTLQVIRQCTTQHDIAHNWFPSKINNHSHLYN